MIAATILSAGMSSRMGFPKALLRYRGATFLQSILDVTQAVGIGRRIVVLGPDSDRILSEHELHGVTLVTNDKMDLGPIGSIKASIQSVMPHPVEGLLVWPVDFPHVTVRTVELMLQAFKESPESIVLPTIDGKRGHPVLFPRSVFDELAVVEDAEGARSVVRADPSRVIEVAVEDPAVVDDLNTPEAYERLLRLEDKIRQ